MPLLRQLLGDAFPVEHERNYILRSPDGLGGGEVAFDCVTTTTFADEAHFQRAMAELGTPEKKAAREADEAKFLEMAKTAIVMVDARKTPL